MREIERRRERESRYRTGPHDSRVLSRVFDYVWLRTRVVTPRTNQSISSFAQRPNVYVFQFPRPYPFYTLSRLSPAPFPPRANYTTIGQLRRWGRQLNPRHQQRSYKLNFRFTYELQRTKFE